MELVGSAPDRRRWLIRLEAITGLLAVVGGSLLAIRPDGSLLQARLAALHGSPFVTWRIPGLLLAILVGGGFIAVALSEQVRWRYASPLSIVAGLGLIAFETAELAWIGPQPLEAIFGLVGVAVVALAWRRPSGPGPLAELCPAAITSTIGIDLYWIPLGAGAHVVRLSGKLYESLAALLQHRPRPALYHSALVARGVDGCYVVEMTPVPDEQGRQERGVVAEGCVGTRRAGRLRIFRYEIRRWRNGLIPDLAYAVGGPVRLSDDVEVVGRLLETVPGVPTPVWGRDELAAGEMWNSNSVTAWLLSRIGLVEIAGGPPLGGRAPGWNAGVKVAHHELPARSPVPAA